MVGTLAGTAAIFVAATVATEGFITAARATTAGLAAHRQNAPPDAVARAAFHHALLKKRVRSKSDSIVAAKTAKRNESTHSDVSASALAAIALFGQDGTLRELLAQVQIAVAQILDSDRMATVGVYGAVGVSWLLLCGARVSAVCPSNLMRPGAFASFKPIVPARRFIHATPREKVLNNAAGERYGCHTCGGREARKRYVADHQPPSKLAGNSKQIFLPHCFACSSLQGGLASRARWPWWTARGTVSHGSTLRWYHLWTPLGLAFTVGFELEPDPLI